MSDSNRKVEIAALCNQKWSSSAICQNRDYYAQPAIEVCACMRESSGPQPANHLHDICHDLDYRPEASRPFFGRENHSPLRSSPGPLQGYHPSQHQQSQTTNHDKGSPMRCLQPVISQRNLDAADITNPDSITIANLHRQNSASPLRRNYNSPSFRDTEQRQVQPNILESAPRERRTSPQQSERETELLRMEIGMLNQRLDQIDRHCRDFTRLASEKSIMEENLKNLAYMRQMQAVHEAESARQSQHFMQAQNSARQSDFERSEQAEVAAKVHHESLDAASNNQKSLSKQDSALFESRLRQMSNQSRENETSFVSGGLPQVEEPKIMISQKHLEACRPARDLSREEKESEAAQHYHDEMARFKRILDHRKESIERAHQESQQSSQAGAFDDDAYLALLSGHSNDGVKGMPSFENRSPALDSAQRNNLRVQFSDEVMRTGGVPVYQTGADRQFNELPPSFRSSFGQNMNQFTAAELHTSSYNAHTPQLQTPVRPKSDFKGRSPSPIKDMNYFEGINAIREEQNAFYQQLLEQQNEQHAMTSSLVQKTRERMAHGIQSQHVAATQKRGRSRQKQLKSRQHDEFAILNYYTKVSKYDLDRANLCMRDAWREKQNRRVENARAKRQMINNEVAQVRHKQATTKVRRIRDISNIRESQIQERRDNAMRHQDMLKSYLELEKSQRKDDRPLQYADDRDTTAFCPNTSAFKDESVRGDSRSASRSPAPASFPAKMWSQSSFSNQKSYQRMSNQGRHQGGSASRSGFHQNKRSGQGQDLIPVRQLQFM